MSTIDYNALVFRVSRRLDELNEPEQLVFMCRDLLPSGSDGGIQDALLLLKKLEECKHLGPDRLQIMKDILKNVEEWSLLGRVEKFETKRREYIDLLEPIIRVLDELNGLERLTSMCRGNIPEESENSIHDVRSLFKVLEANNRLGIDSLDILKEILTELEKEDLIKKVEEFQKRRRQDEEFESRKAQAAAVVSSVRAAGERVIGEVRVHCTFRKISGALLLVGTGLILRRCSSLEEFVEAFRVATLPAANALRAISEGSVCFTVQAEHRSALEALWERYRNGTLQKYLQEFLVTDEIIQLADGEEVIVSVYIDEQEFKNSLAGVEQEVLLRADGREEEKSGEEERPVQPDQPVLNQANYPDQDRLAFIMNWQLAEDTRSMTAETSDSGVPGTHGTPSEIGMEETFDPTDKICLKDISQAMVTEMVKRISVDPDTEKQFCQSLGLDPKSSHHSEVLRDIRELFPDTPIRVFKEVFEALRLYDLVDLLEKAVKSRALRPALPLKEIEKIPNARNRPTVLYSKASVLIVDTNTGDSGDNAEQIKSFFKFLDSRNEVTTITTKGVFEMERILEEKMRSKEEMKWNDESDQLRKVKLRALLKRERLQHTQMGQRNPTVDKTTSESSTRETDGIPQRKRLTGQESRLKEELDKVMERSEQWAKEGKPSMEMAIKQLQKELQKVKEKFEMNLSTTLKKWKSKKDEKSTLFVIFEMHDENFFNLQYAMDIHEMMTSVTQTLAGIPDCTKLWITSHRVSHGPGAEIAETLRLCCYSSIMSKVVATILEVFYKRLETLDIVSMMKEVERTVIRNTSTLRGGRLPKVMITDSLSTLPRLKKNEEDP